MNVNKEKELVMLKNQLTDCRFRIKELETFARDVISNTEYKPTDTQQGVDILGYIGYKARMVMFGIPEKQE